MAHEPLQAGLFDEPGELPGGLVYQPEFLTRADEDALLAAIAPLPLREARFREYFARRRVAHFHDGPTRRATTRGAGHVHQRTAPALRADLPRASRNGWTRRPRTSSMRGREYRPGTQIGWHRDKPAYGIVRRDLARRLRPDALPAVRRAGRAPYRRARHRTAIAVRDARCDPLAMAAQHAADKALGTHHAADARRTGDVHRPRVTPRLPHPAAGESAGARAGGGALRAPAPEPRRAEVIQSGGKPSRMSVAASPAISASRLRAGLLLRLSPERRSESPCLISNVCAHFRPMS